MWRRKWKIFRDKLKPMWKEKWKPIYNRVTKNLGHKIKLYCGSLKTIWQARCNPVYGLLKKKLNHKLGPYFSRLQRFIVYSHKAFATVIIFALLRWFFVKIFVKYFNIETALTQKGILAVVIVLILYGLMLAIMRLFWPNDKKAKVIADVTYNIVIAIILVALTTSIFAVMCCGLVVDMHLNLGLFKISKKFWTDLEIKTYCEHVIKNTELFGNETTKKHANISKIVSESKNSLRTCKVLLLEEMKRLTIIDDNALPARFKKIREILMEETNQVLISQGRTDVSRRVLTAIANPLAWEYYKEMELQDLAYKNSKEHQAYLAAIASLKDMGIKVLIVGGAFTIIILVLDALTK